MISQPFINTEKQLQIIYPFKRWNEISFDMTAIPKQALYFVGSERDEMIANLDSRSREVYQ
jgi:aminopeptidase N